MANPNLRIVTATAEPKPKLLINHVTVLPYRSGDRCGFCWGQKFYVGRQVAECAGCGLPVMIEKTGQPEI